MSENLQSNVYKRKKKTIVLCVVEIFETAMATIIRTEYKHFAIISRIRSAVKHAAPRAIAIYMFPSPALM